MSDKPKVVIYVFDYVDIAMETEIQGKTRAVVIALQSKSEQNQFEVEKI